MTNLLPQEYQKNAKRRMRARFIIAGSLVAIATALIAFFALLPSYLEIRFGVPLPESGLVKVPSSDAQDSVQIQEAQSFARQLAPLVAATSTPAEFMLDALSEEPTGLSVDQITYSAGTNGQGGQLILSGTATSPDIINAYKTTLSQDPRFSSVSLPLGALVGASAGSFTLTLTGNF